MIKAGLTDQTRNGFFPETRRLGVRLHENCTIAESSTAGRSETYVSPIVLISKCIYFPHHLWKLPYISRTFAYNWIRMNKLSLIHSASSLKEISPQAAAEFEDVVEACAVELTLAMRKEPDLADIIGEGNTEVMETNHGNHFRYMSATAALFDPQSFVETVLWVLRTYRARGFSVRYWDIMLPIATTILSRRLGADAFEEIRPFYDWLLAHIPAFARLSEEVNSVYEKMGGLHDHGR